jgi:hypothetical protein
MPDKIRNLWNDRRKDTRMEGKRKETYTFTGLCKGKEETADRSLLITRFGSGYGSVVRESTR